MVTVMVASKDTGRGGVHFSAVRDAEISPECRVKMQMAILTRQIYIS
jgi:hypothetical protein